MSSYWIIEDNQKDSTDAIFIFMKEQIEALEHDSGGILTAEFIPQRVNPIVRIGEASNSLLKKNPGKIDAAQIYNKSWHEFFITDNEKKYELAIFSVDMKAIFPILMEIDEEIANEATLEKFVTIRSINEFQDVFKTLVQTRKVSYVISKLIKLKDNVVEQK